MSLLKKIAEFIFGKTIKIQDDFFGEMTDADDDYECRRLFKPTGKIVEIGLAKKVTGPDDLQINFFHWIEDNFNLIIETIRPSLEEKVKEWIPDYHIEDFEKEFILEYLYIPTCEKAIKEWNISFYAKNELQHWCSIDMVGLEVKLILIDG